MSFSPINKSQWFSFTHVGYSDLSMLDSQVCVPPPWRRTYLPSRYIHSHTSKGLISEQEVYTRFMVVGEGHISAPLSSWVCTPRERFIPVKTHRTSISHVWLDLDRGREMGNRPGHSRWMRTQISCSEQRTEAGLGLTSGYWRGHWNAFL